MLDEFRALPETERRPVLPPPEPATPGARQAPSPPRGGLIIRAYCTYLRRDEQGKPARSKEFYYKENPDRWAAETQSDMLWLTESEWKSLIAGDPRPGGRADVPRRIQKRLFSTVGIDYMEGSVNSLPARDTSLTLTVEDVSSETVRIRVDGHGETGEEMRADRHLRPNSRGCEVRILGFIGYDREEGKITRFDLVGIGRAWGNKMRYLKREIRLGRDPWMYGIACELVETRSPADRIPPYNLLHYGKAGKYFEE